MAKINMKEAKKYAINNISKSCKKQVLEKLKGVTKVNSSIAQEINYLYTGGSFEAFGKRGWDCKMTVSGGVTINVGVEPNNETKHWTWLQWTKEIISGIKDGWFKCEPVSSPEKENEPLPEKSGSNVISFPNAEIAPLVPVSDEDIPVYEEDEEFDTFNVAEVIQHVKENATQKETNEVIVGLGGIIPDEGCGSEEDKELTIDDLAVLINATLKDEQKRELCKKIGVTLEKTLEEKYPLEKLNSGNSDFFRYEVQEVIAEIDEEKRIILTKMKYGGGKPRYDVRVWKTDFKMGAGISFTESDARRIVDFVNKEAFGVISVAKTSGNKKQLDFENGILGEYYSNGNLSRKHISVGKAGLRKLADALE